MSISKLPLKLTKEPLIDVVFGVNFTSSGAADSVLPGLIMSKFSGRKISIEPMPASQLPQAIRDIDPNLRNSPLLRILVDERYGISVGAKTLTVGCIVPYESWPKLCEKISLVMSALNEVSFINEIKSHSLRYVNFFPESPGVLPFSRFKVDFSLAGRTFANEPTQINVEISEDPFVRSVSLLSSAKVQKSASSEALNGVVLDVDTHRMETMLVSNFLMQLPNLLEEIHLSSKQFFFDCLSKSGLDSLEPKYDVNDSL